MTTEFRLRNRVDGTDAYYASADEALACAIALASSVCAGLDDPGIDASAARDGTIYVMGHKRPDGRPGPAILAMVEGLEPCPGGGIHSFSEELSPDPAHWTVARVRNAQTVATGDSGGWLGQVNS